MIGRRDQTTAQIRASAIAEFSEVGPRAFSLQSVAKRGYASVGSVYERWANSDACISDLVATELPSRVDDVIVAWTTPDHSLDALVLRDLTGALSLADLRFIVECAFAARDRPDLRPFVSGEIERLGNAIAARIDLPGIEPTVAWWTASTWLGHALLVTSGCPVPPGFAPEVAQLIATISHRDDAAAIAPTVTPPVNVPLPHPTPMAGQDKTAEALIESAADVIVTQGVDQADTRSIAEGAGLTTGAIYRRYAGRGEVLDDVLRAELAPERYAWVRDFAAAFASDDGLIDGARYLAGLVARTWTDERSAQLLLEITVAAHTESVVRAGVMREITKVAESRTDLLAQFAETGLIRSDLSASTLSWLLQVPPVGMRILASIGMTPTEEELTGLMATYLAFLLSDNTTSV